MQKDGATSSICDTTLVSNTSKNRPNVKFTGSLGSSALITWSPLDSLFTNPGATTAYTGTGVVGSNVVYAKPIANISYVATATM